jgi:hypothetical protein
MNNISFKVSVSSHCLELLEDMCRESCLGTDIVRDERMPAVCILSINTSDYVTDDIIVQIGETIQCFHEKIFSHIKEKIGIKVEIEIVVTDLDDTPIPGVLFPAEYISLVSELEIQTRFHLMINSSTKRGLINSGAYLYIESDNEIDVTRLNRIARTDPSIVYRKGCMGRYRVVDYNAWGLEVTNEDKMPDAPALELMQKLRNAKEIGNYCEKNHLESHVDITCYSISSEPLYFQIEPSFFTFLKELRVRYIDFDFMN